LPIWIVADANALLAPGLVALRQTLYTCAFFEQAGHAETSAKACRQ